jgi:hypothetical protein
MSFNPDGAIDSTGNPSLDHAMVALVRIQTDNIKWLVGKYAPRTYGDKPTEDADAGGPLIITWAAPGSATAEPPPRTEHPPLQITHHKPQPPADLSETAWSVITRVSALIETIAPSDESPESVFGIIEAALRAHYKL